MDIIVDVDGTMSDCTHRLHHIRGEQKNWDAFFDACGEDTPIDVVADVVQQLMGEANRIIFVTGRPERVRDKTLQWMTRIFDEMFDPNGTLLMMRRDGDFRPSAEVKREMLLAMRQLGFKPQLAIEDRKADAEMYRAHGVVVFQLEEGAF